MRAWCLAMKSVPSRISSWSALVSITSKECLYSYPLMRKSILASPNFTIGAPCADTRETLAMEAGQYLIKLWESSLLRIEAEHTERPCQHGSVWTKH